MSSYERKVEFIANLTLKYRGSNPTAEQVKLERRVAENMLAQLGIRS